MVIGAGDPRLNLLLGHHMGLLHSKSDLLIMLLFVSQDHSQAMLLHKPLMVLLPPLLHKLDQVTKPQQNK